MELMRMQGFMVGLHLLRFCHFFLCQIAYYFKHFLPCELTSSIYSNIVVFVSIGMNLCGLHLSFLS